MQAERCTLHANCAGAWATSSANMAAAAAGPGSLPRALTVLDPSTSDDQTSITWHDPMYPYVLTRNSVMHYFEFSPFFDRNSNNMLARRRNLDPAEPGVLECVLGL